MSPLKCIHGWTYRTTDHRDQCSCQTQKALNSVDTDREPCSLQDFQLRDWPVPSLHICTFADIMTLLRWGKAVAFHSWSSKVNTWSSLIALTNECLNRVLLSAIHWCWSNLMLQAKSFCLWCVHKFKKINKIKWSGSDFKREVAWETSGKLRMI